MARDRFGRSLISLWATEPEEGGRPLRAWALLDSGEYASAGWDGGGPEAGWVDLISALRDLRFAVEPDALDAMPLDRRVEPAMLSTGPDRDTAFVAERDDEETWRPAARFRVHLEMADRSSRDGPQDADFDAVVAWARERVDTVLFRPGGINHPFSLGSRPVHEIPEWREGTVIRPRPERTPLDGSVTRRPWPLRASGFSDRPLPILPDALEATVIEHLADADGWTAMIDVPAVSTEEALRRLTDAVDHFDQIGYSSDDE